MIINRSTSLPGERDVLYAALADFSHHGAREKYASWLEENGDPARAATVRATILAYNELDKAHLTNLAGSETWQRVIAVPLLECLIEEVDHSNPEPWIRLRDNLFKLIRPSLALRYEPAESSPPIGSSYLWGHPDIPVGLEWPRISECSNWSDAKDELPQENHCAFLGQFNFAELAETLVGPELPSTGGFMVFSITDVVSLGIHETVVRRWDRETDLERREPPVDLLEDTIGDSCNSPKPPHTIILDEFISIPDASSKTFGELIPGCQWQEPHNDLFWGLKETCDTETLGLAGYLQSTSGDDPSPDKEHLRLAAVRVTPEAGIVHFGIPVEDLADGKLDRVQYVWSDWDS